MVKQVLALRWMHIIRYLLKGDRVSAIYKREQEIIPAFEHLQFEEVSEMTKLIQMGVSLLLSKESVVKTTTQGTNEDYNLMLAKGVATISQRVATLEQIVHKLREKYQLEQSADLMEMMILNVDSGWGNNEDTNVEMEVMCRLLQRCRRHQLQKLAIALLHEGAPIQISQLFRAVRHNAYEFIIEFEFTAGGSVAFKEAH